MKPYIYENMWTQELEDAIEASPTKPLIAEMFYKYGLKVYAQNTNDDLGRRDMFIMTLDGYPYCGVYVDEVMVHNKTTLSTTYKLQYNYYSNYYRKERGRDNDDRKLLRSTRLSNLMKSLEKNKAVASSIDEINGNRQHEQFIYYTRHGLDTKRTQKNPNTLNIIRLHSLLDSAVNQKSIDEETLEYCKSILDLWNKADENSKLFLHEMASMFENDYYILYEDISDGILVGKAKMTMNDTKDNAVAIEIVEPFQRVKQIEDYENYSELASYITMYKVFTEENDIFKYKTKVKTEGGLLSYVDTYIKELNIAINYTSTNSHFDGVWMFIPLTVA